MTRFSRPFALACLLLSTLWAATPPALVNFQGVLRDAAGNPRTGSFDMEFRFYSDPAAGDQVFLDRHFASGAGAVTAAGGLFSTALGGGTLLDGSGPGVYASLAEVFRDYAAVYLEVWVGPAGGALEQLSSRIRVLASAYALNTDKLDGVDAGSFLTTEIDPQVGTVTNGNWCVGDGTAVQCTQPAPVLFETDPQVGALTAGKWCTSNGTAVNCQSDLPAADHGSLTGLLDDDHPQYAVLAPAVASRNTILAASSAVVPLTLKGAVGQVSDLQQWKNNAGTNVLKVSALGTVTLYPSTAPGLSSSANASVSIIDITNTGTGSPISATLTSTTGSSNEAILGTSNGVGSSYNTGIFGYAESATAGNAGVVGWATGNAGSKHGVEGNAMGSGANIAGHFAAEDSGASSNTGVFAVVRSAADNTAGSFQALSTTGINTAIYARAQGSAINRAARLDGDVLVENGTVTTTASSTTKAGLNLPHGAAPSTPANGDLWTTPGGLYARINGATVGPIKAVDGYSLDASDGSPVDAVYVDAAGNVGIGTTTPGYLLDVNGRMRLRNNAAQGSAGLWFDGPTTPSRAFMGMVDDNTIGWWGASWLLGMNVTSGYLGVGTTVPSERLDVRGRMYLGVDHSQITLGLSDSIGSYAYHSEDPAHGDGQAAMFAYRDRSARNDGTGYTDLASNQAIKAMNYWGEPYTFGIAGYTYFDFTRTGGVLGGLASGGTWGSLGYRSAASVDYGGYFTSSGSGSGFRGNPEGIGLGANGGLMGGWIKGGRYGLYASGDRFGLFTRGNAFTTGYQAFVQAGDGGDALTYAVASPTVDVMLHGTATLAAGRTEVEFPAEAASMLSEAEPVAVFLSPSDPALQLSVSAPTPRGFAVVQPGGRSSSVSFAWIAVGRRKGFERVEPPAELLAADFGSNMERVAFDENDREGLGLGLYYDDTLRFGVPPGAQVAPEKEAPPAPAPGRSPIVNALPEPAVAGSGTRPAEQPAALPQPPAPSVVPSLQVPYPAGESIEAGDVLVMSPADEHGLYKCIRAADPMVVGVAGEFSTSGPAEVSVVLAGIAAVRADATLHPIARGDLLVTAPNPGHAMRAPGKTEPGTVVGKALESLATGTGMIRILVMAK